ncbi:MAG: hypothetical protein LKE96_04205 [Acetobacter peroxydans]|jgi:hypothetical protein|nr:hypothetical protein [Acetobacter peroxydans]MCI2007159.1 hypothetical protein [Acetobacter peroxydans]MCI2078419.1 hypothetical protein [Acetobacter peroxydans]
MNTSPFLSSSTSDQQHEDGLEEASMLNALERLGQSARSRPSPRQSVEPTGKRRRFVRDGEVQVEKHTLGRAAAPRTLAAPRPGGGNARAVHFSDEDNGELTRLRRHLAEEKLRAEEAERQLAETQASQRGLMTRAGHADVLVRELKEKLTERETHLNRAMREIKALRERLEVAEAEVDLLRERVESQPAAVPAARRYELAVEESENGGPQPVKWWKD